MRIIAGKFKGKKLNTFELSTTRPTSDMVREALFDKIGFKVIDSVFVDMFSGTGAVGIEAISRGAKQVYFVDKNFDAIKLIKKNLLLIKTENANVLNMDFNGALKNLKNNKIKIDILFLDPPYKTDFAENILKQISDSDLLNQTALVVWEHDKSKLDYINSNFKNTVTKKYGEKFLTYFDCDDLYNIT